MVQSGWAALQVYFRQACHSITIFRTEKQFKSVKMPSGHALHAPATAVHDCPAIFQFCGEVAGILINVSLPE